MGMHITVWNEYRHERLEERIREVYPDGLHAEIAAMLGEDLAGEAAVGTATLDEPEHGLTEEVLERTDVLFWWGHIAHDAVSDEIVERVYRRVLRGMGLVVLHSGHHSKIFRKLMGSSCNLKWREAGEKERIWVVDRAHPVAEGLGEYFELPHEEMYGERFDIPQPDQLVLVSWFPGGEVFRSGCCWHRGNGKVFYFRPGHEAFPTYRDPNVRLVMRNAARWARPVCMLASLECPNVAPLEPLNLDA